MLLFVSPSLAEAQSAVQLNREAVKLYKAKSFERALLKFKAANELRPNPTLDVNIGRCYEQLGRYAEAQLHCKIALNARRVAAPVRDAARACLERVGEKLKRPVLRIDSTPSGARVLVDGIEVGQTPWSGDVEPGRRQVDLELPGHQTYSRVVITELGGKFRVFGSLLPGEVGALLSVTSLPDAASITLNGQPVGLTPMLRRPVAAGNYEIALTKDGYVSEVVSTQLADGSHLERNFILTTETDARSSYRVTWPGWTLVGIGVAAIGLGAYFGLRALDNRSEAEDLATTSGSAEDKPRYDEAVDAMRQNQLTADLLFASGLLSGTGGVLALTWD